MTYSRGTGTSGKLAGDRKEMNPVTLADWVNAGHCPPEALHEVGRLFIELQLASVRAKLGTEVRRARAEHYRPALDRIEVNADSIVFWWREDPKFEGWDADPDTDWSGMADWWNSMPMAKRPIEADWDDDLRRRRPNRVIKNAWSLDSLYKQWNATPEAERPKHFPLDPVVQAQIKSRDSGSSVLNAVAQPDGELSPEVRRPARDYLLDFQRYQQDVRQAIEKDAKEKNGQDAQTALESAMATLEKLVELRTEDDVDLLVGLLRAEDGELHQETMKKLIDSLSTLGSLNHARVIAALDYAVGPGKYGTELRRMYLNSQRRRRAGTG